ncbi:MAG: histidinol dehydrogenase [Nitrospirae bacterium GWC2_46_6]|nr:MAG: histidinol dehydrogenase [Nitrospirae bacterium GWC2_46_6]OGW22607.1 MAG: histidinol dehydrogenase [Nitrospirae bacterium GWA2_46_11]OGW24005.1 MAG: histidinol dehydrogenase [Nitrospirae bacterium GWB2_47_37]
MMRIFRTQKQITAFLNILRERASGASPEIEKTVKNILSDVKKNGDSAVKKYTRKFDGHSLPLKLTAAEIKRSAKTADKKIIKALELSARRIRDFHEKQKEQSWRFKKDGAILGQIIRPIERAGVYVPGGKASYPSTVLMNVIPAIVAGVKEIALCVPTPTGEVNPYVMAAIELSGVKEVYRIGGAQAVGAMAYGTRGIKKVDKIVGPGNIYVALAKKMVFGEVDIDMIAGPSEILIIADETANPSFIAADMLSQAEHDEMASSILATDSNLLAEKVLKELRVQLAGLKRKNIALRSLERFGAVIKTKSIMKAIDIANEIAPEHLEIMTKYPEKDAEYIKNAGAIFLGQWTPEPLGDYSAGPNHTLPTGGTARFSSPLGVYDFIKRTSLLQFDRKGFMLLSDTVEAIADIEGLEAHANTIRIRRGF